MPSLPALSRNVLLSISDLNTTMERLVNAFHYRLGYELPNGPVIGPFSLPKN